MKVLYLVLTVSCTLLSPVLVCWADETEKPISQQITDKTKEVTASVVDGVMEAVSGNGGKAGDALGSATGTAAKWAGLNLAKQLDERAEAVTAVAARALVQTLDGLHQGIGEGLYDELEIQPQLCDQVVLEHAGLMKKHPVIDVYLRTNTPGTYHFTLDFATEGCKTTTLTKTTTIKGTDNPRNFVAVSFALNKKELKQVKASQCAKLVVAPAPSSTGPQSK